MKTNCQTLSFSYLSEYLLRTNVKCCQTLVENVGKSKFCDSGDTAAAETDKKSTQKVDHFLWKEISKKY